MRRRRAHAPAACAASVLLRLVCASVLASVGGGQQQCIQTFAGSSSVGSAGDGGVATAAALTTPYGVHVAAGAVYITDRGANRVRVVRSGVIAAVAGTGASQFSGDGGPATAAALNSPQGTALDLSGALYIADSGNNRIRRVVGGIITTFAGGGVNNPGDGGPAAAAQLTRPNGIAFCVSTGAIYIAETNANRIRVIRNGTITAFAGTGVKDFSGDGGPATAAALNWPFGLSVDLSGAVFIADSVNHRIRVVRDGIITTFAGGGTGGVGGPATSALLGEAQAVAIDGAGAVYIPDVYNNLVRVVRNGTLLAFAGPGAALNDGGVATSAILSSPFGVAADPVTSALYIADAGNSRIRVVSPTMCNGNQPLGLVLLSANASAFVAMASLAGYGSDVCLWDPSNATASAARQMSDRGWVLSLQRPARGGSLTLPPTGETVAVPCTRVDASVDSGTNVAASCQQVARLTCSFRADLFPDGGAGWTAVLERFNGSSLALTVQQALSPFFSAAPPNVTSWRVTPLGMAGAGTQVTVTLAGTSFGLRVRNTVTSAAAQLHWSLTPVGGVVGACGNLSAVGLDALASNCTFAQPHWQSRTLSLCALQQCTQAAVSVPMLRAAIAQPSLRWDAGLVLNSSGIGAAQPVAASLTLASGSSGTPLAVALAGVRATGPDGLAADTPVLPEAFLGAALNLSVSFAGDAAAVAVRPSALAAPLTASRATLQGLAQSAPQLSYTSGGTVVMTLPRQRPTPPDYAAAGVALPSRWPQARAWIGSTLSTACLADAVVVSCTAPAGSAPLARVWVEVGGLLNVTSDGREFDAPVDARLSSDAFQAYAVYGPPAITAVTPAVALVPALPSGSGGSAPQARPLTLLLTGSGLGTAAAGGHLLGLAVGGSPCPAVRSLDASSVACDGWAPLPPSSAAPAATADLPVTFSWGYGTQSQNVSQGSLVVGVLRPVLSLASPSTGVTAGISLTLSGQQLCPPAACAGRENVTVTVGGQPCSVTAVVAALGAVTCITPALPASAPGFPVARVVITNSAGASSAEDVSVTYLLPFEVDWAPSSAPSQALLALPSTSDAAAAVQPLAAPPTVVVSGEGAITCSLRAAPWGQSAASASGCGPGVVPAASATFGTAYYAGSEAGAAASTPQAVGATSASVVLQAGTSRANLSFPGAGVLAPGGCTLAVSVTCSDARGRVASTPSATPLLVVMATLTAAWDASAQASLTEPMPPGATLAALPARAAWAPAAAALAALPSGVAPPSGSAGVAFRGNASASALLSCAAALANAPVSLAFAASITSLGAATRSSAAGTVGTAAAGAAASVTFVGLACSGCALGATFAVVADCSLAATGERLRLPPLAARTLGARALLSALSTGAVPAALPFVALPLAASVVLADTAGNGSAISAAQLASAAGSCQLSSAGAAAGGASLPAAQLTPDNAAFTYGVASSGSLAPQPSARLSGDCNASVALTLTCTLWGQSTSSAPLLVRTSMLRIAPLQRAPLPTAFLPSDGTGTGSAAAAAATTVALALTDEAGNAAAPSAAGVECSIAAVSAASGLAVRLHTLSGGADAASTAVPPAAPGTDGVVVLRDVLIATGFAAPAVRLTVSCTRPGGGGAAGSYAWTAAPVPVRFAPCAAPPASAQSQTALPSWQLGVGVAPPTADSSSAAVSCGSLLPLPAAASAAGVLCTVASAASATAGARSNGSVLYLGGSSVEAVASDAIAASAAAGGGGPSIATFSSLTLTGEQGTAYPLQVSCAFGGVTIPPSPLPFTVALAGCAPGSRPEGVFCAKCPEGSFSLGGARDTQCHACPASGATCSSGVITLQEGFYRPPSERGAPITNASLLLPCFNALACRLNASALFSAALATGVGESASAAELSVVPVPEYGCSEGYASDGPLCGVCDAAGGYAMFGAACGRCWSPGAGRALVASLVLLLIALLIGSAFLGWVPPTKTAASDAKGSSPEEVAAAAATDSSSPTSRTASIALRLLLTHVQFLGAVQAFKSSGMAAFRDVTGWTSSVSASPLSLGPVQCVLQLPYLARFLAIVTLPLTAPASLAAAYALVALVRTARLRRAATGHRSTARCCVDGRAWTAAMRAWLAAGSHVSTAVAVMSLAYMPIVTAALTALDCTDVAIDGVWYLRADLSVPCYTGQHAVARAVAVVVLGVVGLGFPLLLVARLWRAGEQQLQSASFRAAWAGLYEGYRGAQSRTTAEDAEAAAPDGVGAAPARAARARVASARLPSHTRSSWTSSLRAAWRGCLRGRRPPVGARPSDLAAARAGSQDRVRSIWARAMALLPRPQHYLWWEAAILLRKAGIVLVATLAPSAALQLACLILVALAALGAQVGARPYAQGSFNVLETMGLLAVLVTAALSVILLSDPVPLSGAAFAASSSASSSAAGEQAATTALLLAVNGAVLAAMLAVWARLQCGCAVGAARQIQRRRSLKRASMSASSSALPGGAAGVAAQPSLRRLSVALESSEPALDAGGALVPGALAENPLHQVAGAAAKTPSRASFVALGVRRTASSAALGTGEASDDNTSRSPRPRQQRVRVVGASSAPSKGDDTLATSNPLHRR